MGYLDFVLYQKSKDVHIFPTEMAECIYFV